jgi:hypothetical protein
MDIEKMKTELAQEIQTITDNLQTITDDLRDLNEQQKRLSAEKVRLQHALDALEGKTMPTAAAILAERLPSAASFVPLPDAIGNEISVSLPEGNLVTINGEQVILEQGFKVAKNSFGEDCIVPESFNPAPMVEPTKTKTVADPVLPAADLAVGWDKPEDLL